MWDILRKILKATKKNDRNFNKLEIIQSGNELHISGCFSDKNVHVLQLWVFSEDHRERIKIASLDKPENSFQFQCSLDSLYEKLVNNKRGANKFLWYLKIKLSNSDQLNKNSRFIKQPRTLLVNRNHRNTFFVPCGRFNMTKVWGLEFWYKNNHSLLNFINKEGFLSLIIDGESDSKPRIQIDRSKWRRGNLILEGKLFTHNSLIRQGKGLLSGRETLRKYKIKDVEFTLLNDITSRNYGLNAYWYSLKVDFKALNEREDFFEDVYNSYLILNSHDQFQPKTLRVGRPVKRVRFFLKDSSTVNKNHGALIINPYFTFKKSNISFEVYKFDHNIYRYLQKSMRWSWLFRVLHKNKDIWLVGERHYKAQDTGLAFFKYMRTHHPEKDVYYVIDKKSPEYKNVEPYGNILDFKSKEHIKITLIAKKILSSHHPDYLYPIRTARFKAKVRATRVFLQHGVLGTKNITANYGIKATSGFETDYFIVSSDFEKEIVVKDLGYPASRVWVTGLSRFDTLFADDTKTKRQILLIPTWRDWIINEETFFQSDYAKNYKSLINNEKLHELATKYNFDVIFCLHTNMQRFRNFFDDCKAKIIKQGEVNVQQLIKESMLMITDYSSVGFDFSFLEKPVIYYQFDRERFIGKKPSHLDLDSDLPGEICFREEEVIKLVEEYAKNNFRMKNFYKERSNKFIKYRDQSACERIYNRVKSKQYRRKKLKDTRLFKLIKLIYNRE